MDESIAWRTISEWATWLGIDAATVAALRGGRDDLAAAVANAAVEAHDGLPAEAAVTLDRAERAMGHRLSALIAPSYSLPEGAAELTDEMRAIARVIVLLRARASRLRDEA